jgi:hypothetical protein
MLVDRSYIGIVRNIGDFSFVRLGKWRLWLGGRVRS